MKKSGCLSYIIVFVIAFVAAILLTGYLEDNPIEIPDINDILPQFDDDSIGSDDSSNMLPDGSGTMYYSQLNDTEKGMYTAFLEGIEEGNLNFKFNNVEYDECKTEAFRAISALTYDYPEYFWMECGFSFTFTNPLLSSVGTADIDLSSYAFWDYSMAKDQKIAELDAVVKSIASMAINEETHFDRIKFVHDYLVENAIYDHDGLNEYYKTSHDPSCEYIFTAYGCLVNQKTVCAGYAKAFQLIMREMGYDCLYVTGYAGEAHAWNLVFIDGEGYYIDVTWDDLDLEDGEIPLYSYFGLTTEYLERTHFIDEDFTMPQCTSTKYDYFYYTGKHLDVYNFNDVEALVTAQKNEEVMLIRFGSAKEFNRARHDLISNNRITDIYPTPSSYILYDNQYTIIFFP